MLVPVPTPQEAAVAIHPFRRHDLGHLAGLDWILILVGALLAWLLWPPTRPWES